MTAELALRPFREDDLDALDWAEDGFISDAATAVAFTVDDVMAGMASWEAADRGGPPGGCYETGLTLLPEYRGRGLGTAAHRLIVAHLFANTRVHRLEAFTDGENVAEQKTLERLGFPREGVMREVIWRNGSWRDEVIYALFRES